MNWQCEKSWEKQAVIGRSTAKAPSETESHLSRSENL